MVERKNINRGFKQLRVWNDAVELYVLTCKFLMNFPFELKKLQQIVLIVLIASAVILLRVIQDGV